jgi:hypothetical protein
MPSAVLVADDHAGHTGSANPIAIISLPSVNLRQTGNSVLLSWPGEASSFVLESTTSLSPAAWVPVAGSLQGGTNELRVRITGTNGFFRLRYSEP